MPQTLVIVDDHPGFRAVARTLLERGGFQVLGEARDGGEALAAAERLHPDVVLLDVQLPDADGFAVARAMRALANPPMVVLVSGRNPDDYGSRPLWCGARALLRKEDLSPAALSAAVS